MAAGLRADLNVIDLDRLTIHAPYVRADLPAGGTRVLQPSTGYLSIYRRTVQPMATGAVLLTPEGIRRPR